MLSILVCFKWSHFGDLDSQYFYLQVEAKYLDSHGGHQVKLLVCIGFLQYTGGGTTFWIPDEKSEWRSLDLWVLVVLFRVGTISYGLLEIVLGWSYKFFVFLIIACFGGDTLHFGFLVDKWRLCGIWTLM